MASRENDFTVVFMEMGYVGNYTVTSNGKPVKNWEYFLSEPRYVASPRFRWEPGKHRRGFYDVKMTEDYIFCLYSGELFDLEATSVSIRDLMIFDRQGQPLVYAKLDKADGRIAVTPDNKTLYTFSYNDSRLVRYDLSGLLPA